MYSRGYCFERRRGWSRRPILEFDGEVEAQASLGYRGEELCGIPEFEWIFVDITTLVRHEQIWELRDALFHSSLKPVSHVCVEWIAIWMAA